MDRQTIASNLLAEVKRQLGDHWLDFSDADRQLVTDCVDDAACKYIPALKGDARKSKIKVRHRATHSSGRIVAMCSRCSVVATPSMAPGMLVTTSSARKRVST